MKFFQDRYGHQYPITRVRRIEALRRLKPTDPRPDTRYQTVELDGGQTVEVAQFEISEMLSAPVNFIPAQPGTYLLSSVFADDTSVDDVWRSPILAWAIGADGEIKPWTCEGESDALTHARPILHPDGRVDDPHVESYRSITEWFDQQLARAKADQDAPSGADAAADTPLSTPTGLGDQTPG